MNQKINMKGQNQYHKGLFFITYLLINTDKEISDDELAFLHRMRIEEGINDQTFSEYFKMVLETSEKEIYQAGIEALNQCSEDYKVRAFERLFHMAYADKVLRPREVRFILYSMKLTHAHIEQVLGLTESQTIEH